MIGSFPGPIDPLSGTRRFYSRSVPARLAQRWRPRRGARRARDVVHLAVEEDEGLAVLDDAAARRAGALLLVHAPSLPPGGSPVGAQVEGLARGRCRLARAWRAE